MARKQSEFVKAAYKAARVLEKLANAVLDAGGTDDDVRRIETEEGLAEKLAKVVVDGKKAIQNIFRVTVDYSRSLAEMIAAGKYDWSNSGITADHFPVKGEGVSEVELTLVHFNRFMSTDAVLKELAKTGFRPAKIEELLALGEKYHDLQREFPIVALGSVWRDPGDDRRCACLWGGDSRRSLSLDWLGDGWHENFRFLVVRES